MQYETICRELILWSNAQGALPGLCGLPFPGWGDVAVVAPDTFERPTYAGNAILTVRSRDAKKLLTVRTASFKTTVDGAAHSARTSVVLPAPCAPETRIDLRARMAARRKTPSARSISPSRGRAKRWSSASPSLATVSAFARLRRSTPSTCSGGSSASINREKSAKTR